MRNRERIDFDVADLEALARANVLDALDGGFLAGLLGIFRVHFHDFAMRRLGEVRGAVPEARELRDGAGMVGMLVGDQDGVDALGLRAAQRFKAAQNFLAAQASVNEEGGALGFEQRRVARAAGSENGYAERDAKVSEMDDGKVCATASKEKRGTEPRSQRKNRSRMIRWQTGQDTPRTLA